MSEQYYYRGRRYSYIGDYAPNGSINPAQSIPAASIDTFYYPLIDAVDIPYPSGLIVIRPFCISGAAIETLALYTLQLLDCYAYLYVVAPDKLTNGSALTLQVPFLSPILGSYGQYITNPTEIVIDPDDFRPILHGKPGVTVRLFMVGTAKNSSATTADSLLVAYGAMPYSLYQRVL